MTGRQYTRVGCPGVFGDSSTTGLPLNETTVADQLKKAGYATAIMGKWHLGQRPMFLPGARGFDTYLGIPCVHPERDLSSAFVASRSLRSPSGRQSSVQILR
jgi:arylsulfatase A-like enzyme